MWLESERGLGDFHPALLGNGQVLQFYGNQVRTPNAVMDTCCEHQRWPWRFCFKTDFQLHESES